MNKKTAKTNLLWFKRGYTTAGLTILFYFFPFIYWVSFIMSLEILSVGFLIIIIVSTIGFLTIVDETLEYLLKFVCGVIK